MFTMLLVGWGLLGLSVVIHALGVTSALQWLRRQAPVTGMASSNWLFMRLAGWIVFLHLLEITVWGVFYVWRQAMPDLQSGLYFSAVTYTTTGYGDLVLPQNWRLVGAVEALTGILMCGWSTGFFFAVVDQLFKAKADSLNVSR